MSEPYFDEQDRREFLKKTGATAAVTALPAFGASSARGAEGAPQVLRFDQPDSLVHGHEWETLNPGYWQVRGGGAASSIFQLRRSGTSYGFSLSLRNASAERRRDECRLRSFAAGRNHLPT